MLGDDAWSLRRSIGGGGSFLGRNRGAQIGVVGVVDGSAVLCRKKRGSTIFVCPSISRLIDRRS